jgi:aminoglycoside phosphotransferase (APT) family kinase protein
VSRRARGHNIGSRIDIQNPISDAQLRDFMCKLASIHRLPISADNPHVQQSHLRETARCTTRQDAVGQLIAMWQDGINQLQLPPSPIIERALGWLATNIPADTRPPVLLHGDYGLHNILIEDDRVACILDWESSNLGHPLEDLAWLLDGLQARIERQRIIDLYEQASGERVCPATLCYFEVMNVLKFAVTCPTALALFAQHQTTPIDACQLGLFFTYFGTSRLNAAIARAEQLAHPATAL